MSQNYLNQVLDSDEYKNNKLQIDAIKKTILECTNVSETLLDWLISAVENNTKLICEANYKDTEKK